MITLVYLDKHLERVNLEEACRLCITDAGIIIDAETDNTAIQQHLRDIIDRDLWLIERQSGKNLKNEWRKNNG